MSKFIKYFSFFILFLIVLGMLLALFSQTPVFKKWLKNRIISIAQSRIDGTIELKSLQGTFYKDIQLEEFSIKKDDMTIFQFKRIYIQYSSWALLRKQLLIKQVIIEAPKLNLTQLDSTAWYVQRTLKAAEVDSEKIEIQTRSDFGWQIEAPEIRIISGELGLAHIQSKQFQIPRQIRNLNLTLGFWLREQKMNLTLENLSFEARQPDLIVRTIHSEVKYDSDYLQARNFEIETGTSKFISSLDVKNFKDPEVIVVIQGQPISLSEVRRAVPVLKLYGRTRLDFEAKGRLDNLDIYCDIQIGKGRIQFKGLVQVKDLPYSYDLTGKTTNLNLAEITNRPELASNLNFQFHLKGQDTEWGKILSEITVDFDTCEIADKLLTPSRLNASIKRDSVLFSALAHVEGATANISGEILANQTNFDYQVKSQLQHFDLGRFLSTEFSSNFNFDLELEGKGLNYDLMAGALKIKVSPSSLNRVPIESASFDFELEEQILKLHDFSISSPLGQFFAKGDISIHKSNHLKVEADFKDFSVLTNAIPMDSLFGRGRFSGRFEGPLDFLTIETDLDLFQVRAAGLNIDRFNAQCSGVFADSSTHLEIEGEALTADIFEVSEINTQFQIEHTDTVSNFAIQLWRGDDLTAETQGKLSAANDGYLVSVEQLDMEYLDYNWGNNDKEAFFFLKDNKLDTLQLDLFSENQTFSLSGQFNMEGTSHLHLNLSNLDISKYRRFLQQEIDLQGLFSLDFRYNGTLEQPVFSGEFELNNGQYLQVPFEKFSGYFGYSNRNLDWDCVFSKVQNDSLLESRGYFPVQLSFEPFEYEILRDELLEFNIQSRGIDLSFLNAFSTGVQNIKGMLIANVRLDSTLNYLRGAGPIRIFKGEFDIDEFGTKYRNVNVALILQKKEMIIRDFRMESGGGKLKLLQGGLSLSEKSVKNFKAQFKLDDFQIMNKKKLNAKVDGEIELTGSIQSPFLTGDLTVNESRVYYPAWLEEDTFVELTSRPFFIISPDTAEFDTTGAIRFQKTLSVLEDDFTESQFYKDLRGELSVRFPRNTWIRGGDTNIEVEGDLVTVKEGDSFALFGSFTTIRGYYELLGNRFQITRGEMVFNGELEPNPEIDLEAVYEFKDVTGDDPQKHEFKVQITGTLFSPEFKFNLDGRAAEQEDILSILVFGQSYADLTYGQRNTVSEESGIEDKATGFLTGQVLKRLSGQLGKTLKLDVIQIESGKNFEDARLRVGKYITPDVFVSISQDFGAEGNRKVELEYEIPRKILFFNLLLQASKERQGATGLDVIWKIEW